MVTMYNSEIIKRLLENGLEPRLATSHISGKELPGIAALSELSGSLAE